MTGRYPEWNQDGKTWPNREASRFVDAGGYRWHVQQAGSGPVCLFLHGTGAATHSWRALLPLLAEQFTMVAPDLPGHGFTRANYARKVSLEGMAASVTALLDSLALTPALIVGHSAGAAIGVQMLLDRGGATPLIGFAPALMPFPGLAARIFPTLAKMLFTNPFASILFSRLARTPGETERFLRRSTGSVIDAEGLRCYEMLFGHSGHCDGAIRMMANWQLAPLRDRLNALTGPVLLVHPSSDTAIPRSAVMDAAALTSGCEVQEMQGLGHLAHEEDPLQAAAIITAFARSQLAA
jgi:magnesium chelatase accessory protein